MSEILIEGRNLTKEFTAGRKKKVRAVTDVSLQAIGKALGNRDHTTILHGIEKINMEINTNESLRNTVETLKKKLLPS